MPSTVGFEYTPRLRSRDFISFSFKNHISDLQFIEITHRWMLDTQVKIKSEVAINGQQAHTLQALVAAYRNKLDAVRDLDLDEQVVLWREIDEILLPIRFSHRRSKKFVIFSRDSGENIRTSNTPEMPEQ